MGEEGDWKEDKNGAGEDLDRSNAAMEQQDGSNEDVQLVEPRTASGGGLMAARSGEVCDYDEEVDGAPRSLSQPAYGPAVPQISTARTPTRTLFCVLAFGCLCGPLSIIFNLRRQVRMPGFSPKEFKND